MEIKAKKSLGQNFLKSKKALEEMVRAGSVSKEDTVLEIGPGEGALTEKLLEIGAKVIAVEKDNRLIELLNEKFSKEIQNNQFTLIHGDILDIDLKNITVKNPEASPPSEKAGKQNYQRGETSGFSLKTNPSNTSGQATYKLIANIPYYITGLIFRKFLEGAIQPSKLVLMVQKEIADRIIARDGKESILSLSVKAYGKPKKIMKVDKENFSPKPKVDSAILLIDDISKDFFLNEDKFASEETKMQEKNFFEVLKVGFAHKRKVLISNLKEIAESRGKNLPQIFSSLKIPEKSRAEDLKLENWKDLVKLL
jgi:16S rRNA (adenine1518-N6/adenine1519-N6)-dimethyltransferase